MKKKIVSMLIATSMVLAMTACSETSTSSTDASSSASSASTTSESSVSAESTSASSSSSSAASTSDSDGPVATAVVDESREYNISIVLKTLSSEYWQVMLAGIEAYDEMYDNVTVDVVGPSSETSYDEQLNSMTTIVDTGLYDAYVVAPLQSDSAASIYANANGPVIAVDTTMELDSLVSFVGTGNYDAAYEGAVAAVELAAELGWEDIQCIEIAGIQGDEANTSRMEGYRDGVNDSGGTFLDDEVQYANAVADQAVTAMEGIMSKFPEGVAIICANNDDMALAAAQTAADNEAYANTVFLGFNGDSAVCYSIANGEVSNFITIAQNPYEMGFYAVDTAINAINGEEVEAFFDTGVDIITSENAGERYDTVMSYLGN